MHTDTVPYSLMFLRPERDGGGAVLGLGVWGMWEGVGGWGVEWRRWEGEQNSRTYFPSEFPIIIKNK